MYYYYLIDLFISSFIYVHFYDKNGEQCMANVCLIPDTVRYGPHERMKFRVFWSRFSQHNPEVPYLCLCTWFYLCNTSVRCLQTMNKTACESLSQDFSSFKNFVGSVTNLCQGQLKISQEKVKIPKKPKKEFTFSKHKLLSSWSVLRGEGACNGLPEISHGCLSIHVY